MVTVEAFASEGSTLMALMVGRARIELTTNGLKVRCSTD